MNRAAILAELSEIFADVMDLDEVELKDATTADDIEEWDSLSNIRLVVSIERKFKIKFTNAEIEALRCVGDLVDTIISKTS